MDIPVLKNFARWAVLHKNLLPIVFALNTQGEIVFFVCKAFDFEMLRISLLTNLWRIGTFMKDKISRFIVGVIIEKEIEQDKLEILLIIEMTKSDIFFKRLILLEEGFEEDFEEDLEDEEKREIERIIENLHFLKQFIQI